MGWVLPELKEIENLSVSYRGLEHYSERNDGGWYCGVSRLLPVRENDIFNRTNFYIRITRNHSNWNVMN